MPIRSWILKEMRYEKDLSTQKSNNMNQENFDYLKDNLKYMGFGEKLYPQLEKELSKGSPQFQLQLDSEVNGKAFVATLNFRKSDTKDMYFFNSYHASLQRKDGHLVDQAFYLNKGKGVTAKEAYNLLDGRSVFKDLTTKEGHPYKAWIQLDFDKKDKGNNHEVKQFHENYGYDLKASLGKYAIAEMDGGQREKDLMQSLQKGNIQSIAIEKDGSVAKMFIEANPQYKSITLYDAGLNRVQSENLSQFQSKENLQQKDVTIQRSETVNGKTVYAGREKDKEASKAMNKEVAPSQKEEGSNQKAKKHSNKGVKDLLPKKEGKSIKKGLSV
jgi:hypothetical protein